MDPHDQMRSGLRAVAGTVDPGDVTLELDRTRGRARRRQTRQRLAAVAATCALVAGGVVAVVTIDGRDAGNATLVGVDPSTTVPTDTAGTEIATDTGSSAPAATVVQVVSRPGVAISTPGPSDDAGYDIHWSTPWRDGFLIGGTAFGPQPLPTELPEDVRALFPPEVLELFADGLPATIGEATAMLEEAGLLETVSRIVTEHPEASAAIYGAPSPPPRIEARFTTDGSQWEPVEFDLPDGMSNVHYVVGVGDRLVVAGTVDQIEPEPDMPRGPVQVMVGVTTDLEEWQLETLDPPSVEMDLPAFVAADVWPQSLAANDRGWVVSFSTSFQPQLESQVQSLLPDDARERMSSADSFGWSTYDTGVEVSIGVDGVTGQPDETFRFTWEELGIEPDLVEAFSGGGTTEYWASTWDGEPVRADLADVGGGIIGTSAGFMAWTDRVWFSPDGVAWTSQQLPVSGGYLSAVIPFDGGAIVIVGGEDGGSQLYRIGADGGSAERIEVPGLPASVQSVNMISDSSAMVLDAAVPAAINMEPLVVTLDGYELSWLPMAGDYTLRDLATGEVIVEEEGPREAADAAFEFEHLTFGPGGLTVTDPVSGDVLVTIPDHLFNEASEELYDTEEGTPYVPDYWLLATLDGERFIVDDLPEPVVEDWHPTRALTNGTRVLVQSGVEWRIYDLS
jgi:hypothetical protein